MAEVIGKAASGIGVNYWQTDTPLSILSRSPQKLMREAQALYHSNPWIRSAEAAVTRRVVGLPWHLENDQDDEITDGPIQDLLEKPQALLDVGRKMTRRGLTSITTRHMGLCGLSYWYLDKMDTNGVPLGIVYVNPARVWPVTTENGDLRAWTLDAKDEAGHGGTPLRLEELIPFYLDEPDSGYYPTGLVMAAALKARITALSDQHAAYILSTGGRIPGLVSPKAGTLNDDQYAELVRDFRQINESPDAAKRTNVLRGPVDYTTTGGDAEELALLDLSKMNRDDIFAIWGVPPSQVGVPTPAGLNSGETKGYDYEILMQGSVHDRVVVLVETIQYQILDRWPQPVDLIIEEPEFHDETPQYEIALKAKEQPLTRNERRELIGLDPLPEYGPDNEPLGLAIDLPANIVVVGQGPQEEGEFSGAPKEEAPASPPPPVAVVNPVPPTPLLTAGKASRPRERIIARYHAPLKRAITALLKDQRSEIAAKVRDRFDHLARKPSDSGVWWNEEKWNKRLLEALRGQVSGLAQTVVATVTPGKAETFEDRVTELVLKSVGKRVKDINDTTREAIAQAISEGIEQGMTATQLADAIEASTTFDEYRSELIARTESGQVYNDAALHSYRELEVEEVTAIDGDGDEECAARDGQTFSVAEAMTITDHPNGTLDWVPVYAKAEPVVVDRYMDLFRLMLEQNKPAPITVAVSPSGAMRSVIDRDENGKIIGTHDEPLDAYVG